MVGVSLFTATVFAMDSQQAYSGGNSTYIWMPLSILVSLAAVMVIMSAMEKNGADTLERRMVAAAWRARFVPGLRLTITPRQSTFIHSIFISHIYGLRCARPPGASLSSGGHDVQNFEQRPDLR